MLPATPITLRAIKPELRAEIGDESLPTLLRRRRRELGLNREQAAERFGIAAWSYSAWEHGRSEPAPAHYPDVITFLGREPWPEPRSLGERLRAARLRRGQMLAEAAAEMGVGSVWLSLAEQDRREPLLSMYPSIIRYLGEEPWPAPTTLAEALLAERRRRGLYAHEIAPLAGVSERIWRRLESRGRVPDERLAEAIQRFLGEEAIRRSAAETPGRTSTAPRRDRAGSAE